MKKKLDKSSYTRFLLWALIPVTFIIISWANSWEDVQKAAVKVKSLQAKFVQKKEMKILSRPLISEGQIFFRNPDNLRWEYSSPIKSILLMYHGNIKRYIWNNGQYVEDTGMKVEALGIVMEQIVNWLNGQFMENKAFTPKLMPGSPGKIELLPQEKSIKNFIKRIVITLSEIQGIIKSVEIIESENSSTWLEFNEAELNTELPDHLFNSISGEH